MNDPSALDSIRIVLSHTSHPGNIGAAARAMKTMGLSRLYLVNPKYFPHADATARAAGADDILERAVVCASLEEALHGTVCVAALTARRRDLMPPMRWPREAAGEIVAQSHQGEVALVFGTEMSGLSNEEAALCQLPVTIPANPDYSSLNLASAVQILCYELRLAAGAPGVPPTGEFEPAQFEDIERFYVHLEQVLTASGFMDPVTPKRLMPRLRRLFSRTRLEKEEVNILRGILASLTKEVD